MLLDTTSVSLFPHTQQHLPLNKMLPVAIQPCANCCFKPTTTFSNPNQRLPPHKNPIFTTQKISSLQSEKIISTRKSDISASLTSAPPITQETLTQNDHPNPPHKQKLGVVVKPMEKARLVLKFMWMDKNIGIALDQVIPGHGTIPLSPYYFWPRKDAWEELKVMLESKPWISHKQMVILLNQATDIINLWQQSGGDFL